MWQILNVEPTYGVCSICQSHECGVVDGKHQWIHCEALDDSRENIVIGYNCVKLFAENLGIGKTVVEKVVYAPNPSSLHLLTEAFSKLKEYEESIDNVPLVPDFTIESVLDSPIKEVQQSNKQKPNTRNRTK